MEKSRLNPECGKRLKQCIKDANLTQAELASASGFTAQYISNIIVGKKPMTVTAARSFSKILHVQEEFLLCGSDFKNSNEAEKNYLECSKEIGVTYLYMLNAFGVRIDSVFANMGDGSHVIPSITEDMLHSGVTEQKLLDSINEKIASYIPISKMKKDGAIAKSISVRCCIWGEEVIIPFNTFTTLVRDINSYARFKIYEFTQTYIPDELSCDLSYGNKYEDDVVLELMRIQAEKH